MATKQHNLMSGVDLHPNKIDATTGTELTTPSETIYDARWVKGKAYAASTTDTIANTATETAFAQNYVLPANTLSVGSTIRITARGVYGTAAAAPALALRFKAGTTQLHIDNNIAINGSMTNRLWVADVILTCVSTGSSGTVECQGSAYLYNASSSSLGALIELRNTGAVILDTTASQTLQLAAQWGTANAANTINQRIFLVEVLN